MEKGSKYEQIAGVVL